MDTALQSFLVAVPQAAAIWLVMLAVAVVGAAALSVPGRQRSAADPDTPTRRGADARGATDDPGWADRYADEVTVAADRAAATARRRREEWELAQQAVQEAWATFDAAERTARRSAAAAALPVAATEPTPAELADRERYLHRAATAACRRRELTMHELNDILAHRGGWDPTLHPVLQEVALRRAVRERCRAAYVEAEARERQAWHTAEVAASALGSLREEACAARLRVGQERTAGQLWWAEQWAPEPSTTQPLPALSEATIALPSVPVTAVPSPSAAGTRAAAPATPALPAVALPAVVLPAVAVAAVSQPVEPARAAQLATS